MKTIPLPDWSAQGDAQIAQAVIRNIKILTRGNYRQIELALAAIVAGGHILIEGRPGVGKTMLARALAISTGLLFRRISCLESTDFRDFLGYSKIKHDRFIFNINYSPLFANIVLIDDIHHLMPGASDLLLECMEEKQLTVQGDAILLPHPFSIIATQLQDSKVGDSLLKESLLDRFTIKVSLENPGLAAETAMIIDQQLGCVIQRLRPVCEAEKFSRLVDGAYSVSVSSDMATYMASIVAATKSHAHIEKGASSRAVLSFAMMARALCYIRGQAAVDTAVIRELAVPVLAHRMSVKKSVDGAARPAADILVEILSLINFDIP